MGVVVKILIGLLLIAAAGATILYLHQALQLEKQKNATLVQEKSDRDETISLLQQTEASNKKWLTQLQTERNRIVAKLTERESFINGLYHDNPDIQDWADTPLPDAIVRLRQRADTTGAGDLHPELPTSEPLLPAGSQPAN
jgi:LysB family phage lysis regulatory protein